MQKYPKTTVTSAGSIKTVHTGREHYSHKKADARKLKKQDEAAERQLHYESLSLKEKLKTCKPGGSKKQRAKLEKEIGEGYVTQAPVKKVTIKKKAVKKT